MNETFNDLKNILSDYNIDYVEMGDDDISYNNFIIDTWDVTPNVNYNEIEISLTITFSSFLEYLDMWTPTFQRRLNLEFHIVQSQFSNTSNQLTVDLFIKVDKDLV